MKQFWKITICASFLLLCNITLYAQDIKPPYILGINNIRIKSKNFLVGKKRYYGTAYTIFNDKKPGGVLITFDKSTNQFDMVTGAETDLSSINYAKKQLKKAEASLLKITGIAPSDRCQINIILRLIIVGNGTMPGGKSWDYLPSCGDF
jgi:hypothetical protein